MIVEGTLHLTCLRVQNSILNIYKKVLTGYFYILLGQYLNISNEHKFSRQNSRVTDKLQEKQVLREQQKIFTKNICVRSYITQTKCTPLGLSNYKYTVTDILCNNKVAQWKINTSRASNCILEGFVLLVISKRYRNIKILRAYNCLSVICQMHQPVEINLIIFRHVSSM